MCIYTFSGILKIPVKRGLPKGLVFKTGLEVHDHENYTRHDKEEEEGEFDGSVV